ncbi:24417_t:CDS:1, partial [Dentiscutata erythropus]
KNTRKDSLDPISPIFAILEKWVTTFSESKEHDSQSKHLRKPKDKQDRAEKV